MEIKNYYYLGSKFSSNSFTVNSISLTAEIDDRGKTDAMNLLEGQLESFKFPIVFKHVSGKNHCDLIGTGWGILYLISDRIKKLLEENNLTGWKSFPVEIIGNKGEKIHEVYHGFSIVGRSGSINYKKSEIIEKRLVPNGPQSKYYKGLHPGMENWDGSDFFLPEKHWGIIVTQKAKDILTKHQMKNLVFHNLADMEIGVNALINN